MAKLTSEQFMQNGRLAASNVQIMNTVRAYAPNDYKTRIPVATQGNISQVMRAMNAYTPNWDVFWNVFVGTIGRFVINNRQGFQNPLKFAKKAAMPYGMTIEESQANLVKARRYDPQGANVFGREGRDADIRVNYHMQDRQDDYELSIPMQDVLRGAFIDGGSIASFFNALMGVPSESAENDEYILMRDLLAKADQADGFYNVQVPDFTGADRDLEHAARTLARAVRAMNTKIRYYSPDYTAEGRAAGLQSRARDTLLLVSADADASMNVDMYQYAFHAERGEMPVDKIVVLDKMPIAGCSALLMDSEAFMCCDTLGPLMLDSGLNPQNMSYNYFYHVWQVLSLSRFLPIVMFSTRADTDIVDIVTTYTGVTLQDASAQTSGTYTAGDTVQLTAKVAGAGLPNQAVRFEVKAFDGKGRVRALPAGLFVDSAGALHLGGVSPLDKVIVTAVCLENEALSADYTVTVDGGTAVTALTATPAAPAVNAGETAVVKLAFTPSDATDKSYEVYSLDTSVVDIVSADAGQFTLSGKEPGTAIVAVIAKGTAADADSVTKSLTVTVS